jgi:hypothetical protein
VHAAAAKIAEKRKGKATSKDSSREKHDKVYCCHFHDDSMMILLLCGKRKYTGTCNDFIKKYAHANTYIRSYKQEVKAKLKAADRLSASLSEKKAHKTSIKVCLLSIMHARMYTCNVCHAWHTRPPSRFVCYLLHTCIHVMFVMLAVPDEGTHDFYHGMLCKGHVSCEYTYLHARRNLVEIAPPTHSNKTEKEICTSRTFIYIYIHTYIHTYVCICIYIYIYIYINAHTHT